MANVFTESFSTYATTGLLLSKWNGTTSGSPVVGAAYNIGAAAQGLRLPFFALLNRSLPVYGHYFSGIRFKWVASNISTTPFLYFTDNVGTLIGALMNAPGTITLKSGSTVLATSTLTVTVGSTHYYELEVQPGAAGVVKLYVDGVLFASYAGALGTTPYTLNSYAINSGGGEMYAADCYINDDTTSICNARQGDTSINPYHVNAAGTYAQFNRGGADTGTNAGQLNKALADPTSFTVNNIVNNRDSFLMGTIPPPSVGILGARLWAAIQKDSFGSRQVALTCKSGATDNIGTSQLVPGTSYAFISQDYSADPNTAALWASVTPMNLAEFGYKITV